MKEPHWMNKNHVLAFHSKQIKRFGGSYGIRDENLLESALSSVQQLFYYEEASLIILAANYAFKVIKNHPFVDGNKRTGMITAGIFLELNGYELIATEEELVVTAVKIAASKIKVEELVEWFTKNVRKIS